MNRWWSPVIVAVFTLMTACGYLSCESPIERERRELQEATESSDAVLYRGIKVVLRSAPLDEESAPPDAAATKIAKLTRSLLTGASHNSHSAEPLAAAEYLQLATELYELRDELRDVDEDDYPTLAEQIAIMADARHTAEFTALKTWYDPAWEHLVLALLWTAGQKAPPGFVLYELSRLDPSGLQVDGVRVPSRLVRAVVYLQNQWPWLSEEESTAYLSDLETSRAGILTFTRDFTDVSDTMTDDQVYAQWHAPGVMLRGVARMKKGDDDERMLDDFDAALVDADTLGLDDEGVWVIDAYVGLKRGDTDRALVSLRKLKASERLGSDEKQLVSEAVEALEDRDPDAALKSLTDKVLLAKIVGGYALRVLAKVDWRSELEKSEAGRGMLGIDESIRGEVERTKAALSPSQLEDLGRSAAQSAKQLGGAAADKASEVWHRAVK
jgi:hypothetical protein